MGLGKLHPSPPPQGRAKSSGWRLPFSTTWPSSIAIVSPGPATTRLMKLTSARSSVGSSQASPAGGSPPPHWLPCSAPAGGWNTTMSPTWGSLKRAPIRLTSTRWPISSVGTIDSDGIRYGLTRNAWMPSASPRAMTTIMISSSSELDAEEARFTLLVVVGRRGLGGLGLLGDRGLAGAGGVGRLGLGE